MPQGIVFFKERRSEIEKSLLTVQSSIDFWETELDKMLAHIDEVENKPWYPEKDEDTENLVRKCSLWLKRGTLEKENLTRLEKEMEDFESEMLSFVKEKPMRIEINVKIQKNS
jgi:hypothetical protein